MSFGGVVAWMLFLLLCYGGSVQTVFFFGMGIVYTFFAVRECSCLLSFAGYADSVTFVLTLLALPTIDTVRCSRLKDT